MWLADRKFAIVALLLEIAIIFLFGFFTKYEHVALPWTPLHNNASDTRPKVEVADKQLAHYYPLFQDIHVMVFVGIGFLFTFLKKYGYSAVGCNMFIGAFLIQWAILCEGFYSAQSNIIYLNIEKIVTADVAAATGLISWGAVLGKTSPLQMLIMAFFEVLFYALNEWLVFSVYQANDPGTSMTCHMFAAYFGLAVSFVLYRKHHIKHPNETTGYTSDVFSMLGTLFLWAFWPSFNAVILTGDVRYRAIINTYLSMTASCILTFITSSLLNEKGKFNMVQIQNATLAGGVAAGCVCGVLLQPYGALLIGSVAAIICTLGFQYLTSFLAHNLRIHDTGGINNLHGMVAIFSSIVGAILASLASFEKYGLELYILYPAMVPVSNSSHFNELQVQVPDIKPGMGRSSSLQAGYQIFAMLTTLGIAIVGGLFTGAALRMPSLDPLKEYQYYSDIRHWQLPEELNENLERNSDSINENELPLERSEH